MNESEACTGCIKAGHKRRGIHADIVVSGALLFFSPCKYYYTYYKLPTQRISNFLRFGGRAPVIRK